MPDYLTTLLGPDPLPRGTKHTYKGIWSVTAWNGRAKMLTLLLGQERIQNPDDAKKVAAAVFDKSKLTEGYDSMTTDFIPETTP